MKFLVLSDGAETSRCVLPHAEAFRRALQGELLLVRISDAADDLRAEGAGGHQSGETDRDPQAETDLRTELEAVGIAGAVRTGMLRADESIARAALRIAEEAPADLIIMGTRGRGSLREALFGSVAREVLQRARVPVMLVSPACQGAGHTEPYRLLVTTDGSLAPSYLARVLQSFLASGEAEAVLLSVYLPRLGDAGEEAEVRALEGHLFEIGALLAAPARSRAMVRALQGLRTLEAEILGVAQEVGASVLVVFSEHLGAPEEPLVRSTARYAIRHSPIPVLLMPPAS
jgi:nucleotide-binding universal stress UspA family protein